jgi:ATP/maltotriose-dependent transcriptional regulator MalT
VASIEIVYSLLTLATVRQRQGRHDEARALHEQARQAVRACNDPGILRDRLARTERRLRLQRRDAGKRASGEAEPLSAAELNVLRLLRSEMSQREIAGELQVSFNTIKTHTRNIYRKFGVATRSDALARAHGLSLL